MTVSRTGVAHAARRLIAAAGLLLVVAPAAWADGQRPGPIVKTLIEATTTGDGQPLVYPTGKPLITSRLVEIPPGGEIPRHRHPTPLFAYILEGELTIHGDGLPPRRFKAGDAFMELAGWHAGRNETSAPVRLLSVYSGAVGIPLSERAGH